MLSHFSLHFSKYTCLTFFDCNSPIDTRPRQVKLLKGTQMFIESIDLIWFTMIYLVYPCLSWLHDAPCGPRMWRTSWQEKLDTSFIHLTAVTCQAKSVWLQKLSGCKLFLQRILHIITQPIHSQPRSRATLTWSWRWRLWEIGPASSTSSWGMTSSMWMYMETGSLDCQVFGSSDRAWDDIAQNSVCAAMSGVAVNPPKSKWIYRPERSLLAWVRAMVK